MSIYAGVNNISKNVSKVYVGQNGISVPIKTIYAGVNNHAVKVWGKNTPIGGEIYGVEWDGSTSTQWTRTDDSVGFADPVAALLNTVGSSPFDNIMPWSGMTKSTDANAGEVVSIPKFYYKIGYSTGTTGMKIQISMTQHDGFLCSPAHADRGDGKGERDIVYVGRYHCRSTDYQSVTNAYPATYKTISAARSGIHNLGESIWQFDYAMLTTIWMLYLVEYADWNSQSTIGMGGWSGNPQNSGATDNMQYHTGIASGSRSGNGHIQYRNIEDLWTNVYDYIDGIYSYKNIIYCIKNPYNFSDSTGGTQICNALQSSRSYVIKAWNIPSIIGFEYAMIPSEVYNNSWGIYVTDRYQYSVSSSTPGAFRFGGDYSSNTMSGLFEIIVNNNTTGASANGCRLMVLP